MIDASVLQARMEFYRKNQASAARKLQDLDAEREQTMQTLYGLQGAIQDCEYWLEHLGVKATDEDPVSTGLPGQADG